MLIFLDPEFAYTILRSLQTSSVARIVDRLTPLLHLDPVMYLPVEITYNIFSYLACQDLLKASSLSRSWRGRAMDTQLWKILFASEGWAFDVRTVRAFEEKEKARRLQAAERKSRAVRGADNDFDRHASKRRARDVQSPPADEAQQWAEQHGQVEADETPSSGSDDRMQDVAFHNRSPLAVASSAKTTPVQVDEVMASTNGADPVDPPIKPTLTLLSSADEVKLNWQFLYKQKKRLEDNWNAGRFANFQLPHPSHPQEAHTECVYTIQYSGKYLVSGSRDKTVRIWDLNTQRLVVPPLVGHDASVLCLQFDERPEQDIVVTGGSDCHVLLWQFSTGKLLKKMERAHSESVLNLRFDDRYLITCSKDKSIKIWNRQEISPSSDLYPITSQSTPAKFPAYIVNIQHQLETQALDSSRKLTEYTLLMTLEGHSAAVNAIQIFDGQVVSASGDRTVKIWDVRTGACLKTLQGHTKGIACVQFDGRRIVSGSSDQSVRIFDRATGAEVACLQGHQNLVRTVQADFGDLPGQCEAELEAEARAIDKKFFEARENGAISLQMTREQRHARNAGSRDPSQIFAFGAKLPPGGGGSKWGRIVSGSYDETVIIWKRDSEGKWVPSRVLAQGDAVRGSGGRPRQSVRLQQHHQQAQQGDGGQAPAAPNGAPQQQQQPAQSQQGVAQATIQHLTQQTQNLQAQIQMHLQNIPNPTPAQIQSLQNLWQTHQIQNAQALAAAQAQANQHATALMAQSVQTATTTHTSAAQAQQAQQAHQQAPQPQPPQGQQPLAQTPAGAANPQPVQVQGQTSVQGAHQPQTGNPLHAAALGNNSRVFKLQFDARRIVCCSQDPRIVGWDFANGDADIIAASQFFGKTPPSST